MFIPSMLLQESAQPFDDDDYLTELKLDGIRCIISHIDDVRIYTRHGNDVTNKFPELHRPSVKKGTVVDGELIVTSKDGKPDFYAAIRRLVASPKKIDRLMKDVPVQFVAFDLLYDGQDITHLPLEERKIRLDKTVKDSEHIAKMRFVESNGNAMFELVKKHGLEGIVLKKKKSRYEKGKRSWSWQKVINYQEADVMITGYRKKKFGWLISEVNGKPAGILELGVDPKERKAFYAVADSIKIDEDQDFIYLEPMLRCHVKFRNWTKNGYMRLPVFQGFCYKHSYS